MPRTLQADPEAVLVRDAPRLDDYFEAVLDANPFAANRVSEPSPYDVDVPAIHGAEFDRLVALAGQAMGAPGKSGKSSPPRAIGAALMGGAGVGKSHLLSRLYRWANGKPGDRPRACYVFLHNLLADPERLPRYLLKCVISALVEGGRGPLHKTPLYGLVEGAVRRALGPSVTAFLLKEGVEAYQARFAPSCPFPEIHQALLQFLRHAREEMEHDPTRRHLASQAVAWLSGEEIDGQWAQALGLKGDGQGPVVLGDDQDIEHVLITLARLALDNGQPFVLCVDQVDNLEADKIRALARFLHALIDHAQNLLAIISGNKGTLLAFLDDSTIQEAAWNRIAEYQIPLLPINQAEARHILEARLERFHEPFLPLEPVRHHIREDALFPLGREWLQAQLSEGLDFRPRLVLTWARDAWEQEQARLARMGGAKWLDGWPYPDSGVIEPDPPALKPGELEAAIDAAVERKIEEQVAQRRLQPGSLPPDAGNLAGLVEAALRQCGGDGRPYTFRGVERMKKPKVGKLPPYDLKVFERREGDGKEVTTGVQFITNIGTSATAALRRLLEDDQPPDHRLLVSDQERRPLKVGAQGVAYYHDLEKLGRDRFEHIKLNFQQYAELDALEGVVHLARVGDLEIEAPRGKIRRVSEDEVIASHHRQDRYRHHPLLRPLLTEDPPSEEVVIPRVTLDERDARQYVMAQLAWMMGSTAKAIAKGYVAAKPALKVTPEAAWPRVKAIAEAMHAEGLIHAQPLDDDLFLLRRK